MKKKIVFLSSLIPETLKTEVKQKMKKGMPDAASALQWHLIEGLYYNYQSSISLINVLPILFLSFFLIYIYFLLFVIYFSFTILPI